MAVYKDFYFMHDIMIVFSPCLLDIIDMDAFMNIPGVINSNFGISDCFCVCSLDNV